MFDFIPLQNFKLPLYEQVRLNIQEQLSKHVWDINHPIPSELELSEQYRVSIGTVRKAIERLVEEGLLVKMQGKGTFIRQPNFAASPMRFFRFRNRGGNLIEPVGLVKKIQPIAGIQHINSTLKLAPDEGLIYLERVRLIDSVIKLSEKIWLPHKLFACLLDIPLNDFANLLYPFYYERCNQFITSATEQLTFLQGYQDSYLKNSSDEPLLKICRIAKNISHHPVEYRESWGHAANFQYEINIF